MMFTKFTITIYKKFQRRKVYTFHRHLPNWIKWRKRERPFLYVCFQRPKSSRNFLYDTASMTDVSFCWIMHYKRKYSYKLRFEIDLFSVFFFTKPVDIQIGVSKWEHLLINIYLNISLERSHIYIASQTGSNTKYSIRELLNIWGVNENTPLIKEYSSCNIKYIS